MADAKLCFLGEEHTVPSELREFVGYLNDFDEIRNKVMELLTSQMRKKREAENTMADILNTAVFTQGIKCPVCGSTRTNKIFTANRLTSVIAFGLASSNIGKQYECKN